MTRVVSGVTTLRTGHAGCFSSLLGEGIGTVTQFGAGIFSDRFALEMLTEPFVALGRSLVRLADRLFAR